jgi:hypothetical protein
MPTPRSWIVPLALLLIAGCNLPPAAVWMYVDNTGESPLVVWVDGKEAAKVAAGEFEVVKCPPGEHEILVKCEGEMLLEGKYELAASEQFATARKYVLDPHKQARYAVYKAEYGSNPFKGMFRSAVLGAAKTPVDETKLEYLDLLKRVEELPPATLVDASYTQYMLTDPPESVMTKSSSVQRTVLARIDPKDHAFLRGARLIKDPTEEDVDALAEVIERIMFTPQDE